MWMAALVLTVSLVPDQPPTAPADQPFIPPGPASAPTLRLFLDCNEECFEEYLRAETPFVDYVRDRSDADVHLLITRADTGSRGREYTLTFIGRGRFAAKDRLLSIVSESGDSEDRARRQLATALSIGLLNYLAPDRVPDALAVAVQVDTTAPATPTRSADPWRRWIYAVEAEADFEAEQSTRQLEWSLEVGADRITEDWKTTFGVAVTESREEFHLDDDQPVNIERRERDFSWLAARSVGNHFAVGTTGGVRSSTFDNTALEVDVAPAIEWNYFPYSMYTRRQLRVMYAVGARHARYYEETLFGELAQTLGRQALSMTYEQQEPWGTLEGQVEWSNYLPDVGLNRLDLEGEVSLRVSRGLSVSIEAATSRIRDQLSLPRRSASSAEVLLQLRELRSDFEASVRIGITYQFGSVFAGIVNPRFGE